MLSLEGLTEEPAMDKEPSFAGQSEVPALRPCLDLCRLLGMISGKLNATNVKEIGENAAKPVPIAAKDSRDPYCQGGPQKCLLRGTDLSLEASIKTPRGA